MSCVSIIVACDPRGIIGKEGKLPWRLPEDLKLFRERTMGCAIIMGRKTWDSIPKKPLDGRANIVISRTTYVPPTDSIFGPHYFTDLQTAIKEIRDSWKGPFQSFRDKDIYIIGGEGIYREAIEKNIADRIIMSKITKEYDGDVKFPLLSNKDWLITLTEHKENFDVVYMNNKRYIEY